MSTILNELVKIREKLDSDGTYSGSNAGVSETVTQIRELVENGAGSGGGKVFEVSNHIIKATPEEMEVGALAIIHENDGATTTALLCMAIDAQVHPAVTIFLTVEHDGIVRKAYQYDAEEGGYVALQTPGGGGSTPPLK